MKKNRITTLKLLSFIEAILLGLITTLKLLSFIEVILLGLFAIIQVTMGIYFFSNDYFLYGFLSYILGFLAYISIKLSFLEYGKR